MRIVMIVADLAGMMTMVTEFGSGWIQLGSLGLNMPMDSGIQIMEESRSSLTLVFLVGTTTVMKVLLGLLKPEQR